MCKWGHIRIEYCAGEIKMQVQECENIAIRWKVMEEHIMCHKTQCCDAKGGVHTLRCKTNRRDETSLECSSCYCMFLIGLSRHRQPSWRNIGIREAKEQWEILQLESSIFCRHQEATKPNSPQEGNRLLVILRHLCSYRSGLGLPIKYVSEILQLVVCSCEKRTSSSLR